MAGIVEVLRATGEPGGGVVVNPPVYPPFFDDVPEAGRRVVEVPLARDGDGWTLDLDGLAAAFRAGARTYLLCSPHNPLGRVWRPDELAGVVELADRYGVLLLGDEIHAPLTLPGERHTPLATLAGDRCVAFWAASKAWNLAGLKCAVAVTSGARGRRLLGRLAPSVRYRSGILGVLAAEVAFTEGQPWLDALRGHLDRNRRLLADLLAERLPEVGYRPPGELPGLAGPPGVRAGRLPGPVIRERRVAHPAGARIRRSGAGTPGSLRDSRAVAEPWPVRRRPALAAGRRPPPGVRATLGTHTAAVLHRVPSDRRMAGRRLAADRPGSRGPGRGRDRGATPATQRLSGSRSRRTRWPRGRPRAGRPGRGTASRRRSRARPRGRSGPSPGRRRARRRRRA